jgi:hypothetical protein
MAEQLATVMKNSSARSACTVYSSVAARLPQILALPPSVPAHRRRRMYWIGRPSVL